MGRNLLITSSSGMIFNVTVQAYGCCRLPVNLIGKQNDRKKKNIQVTYSFGHTFYSICVGFEGPGPIRVKYNPASRVKSVGCVCVCLGAIASDELSISIHSFRCDEERGRERGLCLCVNSASRALGLIDDDCLVRSRSVFLKSGHMLGACSRCIIVIIIIFIKAV